MVMVPSAAVAGLQVTSGLLPVPPQHSALLVQRLFRILQPRPGWQTFTPVSAHGPQFRLQQLPQPLHSTPSCVQAPAPVVATSSQVPSVAPEAIAQEPPQQSLSRAQASPGWMQKEDPSAQVPFEQRPEQQPPAEPPSVDVTEQGLPAVLQLALSAWQVPPLQLPPQHWPELVQLAPSATQAPLPQTPREVSHSKLQQSVAAEHLLPTPLHEPIVDVQV
jgi:hypothetical protein